MRHRDSITLLVELYESEFSQRNEEFSKVLQKNIECEYIDSIIVFADRDVNLCKDQKITRIPTKKRMTYADYFTYCNNNFCENTIYIIANNDIYFDNTLAQLEGIKEDYFVCLTRWNTYDSETEIQGHEAFSQDVWAFRKKIPEEMINTSFFYQGTQCCDNHICFLAIVNNFKVINPCHLIKSYHVHQGAEQRTYDIKHREIYNTMLLSTVDPSDSLEYKSKNVGSFFSMNDNSMNGAGRLCSDYYIQYIQQVYQETFKLKLLKYNKLKKEHKDKPMVKHVSF
tara:strand:+ start:5842 stop:6690 length:849 start_codon:yes stop_codon:yes gene_type:complete